MTRHVPYDITSSLEETPADGSAPAVDRQSAGEAELPQQVRKGGKTAAEPDHFDTEHLLADLKGRSIRGGAVTLGAQGIKFVLNLVSVVVLARLLTPADFGLVAMVTALTGFVAMFKDAGLSMATVQRDQINHAQVSTLFWINVALSLILMCVVAALAPFVAWFYGEPELVWVTLAIAATFILGGLTPQHKALLKRQMRFTAMACKDIAAMAAGIAVAITLAWLGAGYWALVAMGATSSLVSVIMVWSLTRWVPGLPRRGTGVRSMLVFGGNLTGFNFVNYFARNADNVLIGWYWGAGPLGLYAKAYSLLMLPLQQVRAPLSRVIIPALSRLQNDPGRYRRYYANALSVLTLVAIPPFLAAVVVADWLILVVLGNQWVNAANVFRWLALAGVCQIALAGSGWLLITQDRTAEQLRWGIINAAVSVTAIIIGLQYGIEGVAAAYAISGILIRAPLYCWFIGRRGPINAWGVIAPARNAVVFGIAMFAVASVFRAWSPFGETGSDLSLAILLIGALHLVILTRTYWSTIHGALRYRDTSMA